MPGRADDLIRIPASFWDRPEVITALRNRDIGRFFALVQQYTEPARPRSASPA